MKKNTFTKALTLCSFVVLLSGFVAFKYGSFDELLNEKQTSANTAGSQLYFPTDSDSTKKNKKSSNSKNPTTTTNTRQSPNIMPSSKSMMLPEKKIEFDTTKKTEQKPK
jgi:hypothetical protein